METWLLKFETRGKMYFQVSPPPSSWERRGFFPPSVESLWALLGCWVDSCCVCGVLLAVWCELRSHHTRHRHKGKLCLAELVPRSWLAYRNGHFVTAETLKKRMLSSGPRTVIHHDESAFLWAVSVSQSGLAVWLSVVLSTGLLLLFFSRRVLLRPLSPVVSAVQRPNTLFVLHFSLLPFSTNN